MTLIIIRKFFYAAISLLAVSALTFFLMKTIPGDPFQQERALPTEIYNALRQAHGLEAPLHHQYLKYVGNLCAFELGSSLVYEKQTVFEMISYSFPISALLGGEALILAITLGLLFGLLSAFYQHRWQSSLTQFLAIAGISIPSFILGTFMQYLFAVKLKLFPIACWGSWMQTILPALSLAALPAAFIARITRSNMIEELKQGYITTARAKGLPQYRIVWHHALKNILAPILSYLGPLTAHTLTGSFIIEKIYSIPGLGYWFVTGVSNRDYPLIMGITLFYCSLLLIISLIVDITSLLLDPRLAAAAQRKRSF